MMNLAAVLSVGLVLFTLTLPAQEKTRVAHDEEFRRIACEWMDAYNSRDVERLSELYMEDAMYVSSHVPALIAHGREQVGANFKRGMDAGGHVDTIQILKADISGDISYLVCLYEATNSGVHVSGRNVIVSKKIKGKWLIAAHVSVVRD